MPGTLSVSSSPALPLSAPPIELQGITVRFGPVTALEQVDLSLAPGERHAVIGENGAGKSTLMKVLFGLQPPDSGNLILAGQPRQFRSAADAIALGIGMVQQHFELIGSFTALENILLGAETGNRFGLLDRHSGQEAVGRLMQESGLSVPVMATVDELSLASQQRVEILKALYRQARVLILDEPTAVLAPSEASDLWAAVGRLSAAGVSVVFITHKLEEVMANADRITVLRRGRRVLSAPVGDTNPGELADAMIGADSIAPATPAPAAAPSPVPSPAPSPGTGETVLTLEGLRVSGRRGEWAVDDATLALRSGEILGLAGVDGSGQIELLEAILGLRPLQQGRILWGSEEISGESVDRRRARGIGYVPEDRHQRAVALALSCEENIALGRQREAEFSRAGWLQPRHLRQFLAEQSANFDIRGAAFGFPIASLSGGNQQKLVLARELSRQPRLLIASQPTRGLDFGATAFVHRTLRSERDRGVAVLLQSLDLDEVLALSDRVAVMLAGRIVAVLDREDATEARVGALMTGAEPAR